MTDLRLPERFYELATSFLLVDALPCFPRAFVFKRALRSVLEVESVPNPSSERKLRAVGMLPPSEIVSVQRAVHVGQSYVHIGPTFRGHTAPVALNYYSGEISASAEIVGRTLGRDFDKWIESMLDTASVSNPTTVLVGEGPTVIGSVDDGTKKCFVWRAVMSFGS